MAGQSDHLYLFEFSFFILSAFRLSECWLCLTLNCHEPSSLSINLSLKSIFEKKEPRKKEIKPFISPKNGRSNCKERSIFLYWRIMDVLRGFLCYHNKLGARLSPSLEKKTPLKNWWFWYLYYLYRNGCIFFFCVTIFRWPLSMMRPFDVKGNHVPIKRQIVR